MPKMSPLDYDQRRYAQKGYAALGLEGAYNKVLTGERLSAQDGLDLFNCPDILALGNLAHIARTRLHGDKAYYVRNRQINYSNICSTGCTFCAFKRKAGEKGAFALSQEEIIERALDDDGVPFAEIHIVGGCHPSLRLGWFEELFVRLKSLRPQSLLKTFTTMEIAHFAKMEGISTLEVLQRLQKAGVVMLTGGGAEIFDPEIRQQICPQKISGEEYLRISGQAHSIGMRANCTMLFGHIENYQHRVEHLCAMREQQDKSGGFVCFIPLAYQTEHNELGATPAISRDKHAVSTGLDRLRTIAVSRLLLDNIPHIKAYWVMLGTKIAQTALFFGADDLDGTIIEERIGNMAGAQSGASITRAELEGMISASGFTPVSRDSLFNDCREKTHAEAQSLNAEAGKHPFAPIAASNLETDAVVAVVKKCAKGERLSPADALTLYREAGLYTLGALANAKRHKLHPDPIVTYVGDRNINYSNVCVCGCRFCAFYRAPDHPEAYVLDRDTLSSKMRETEALGGTQILLQGGHHPHLPLSYYEDMIAWMRQEFPAMHLHAFSPPEIAFFAAKEGLEPSQVIARLKAAGLHSIPGGGAEILVSSVRKCVSPNKCSAETWLDIMRNAHQQGLKTTATMMFGHEEKPEDRLAHLFALRSLQDETNGFTAFIPWTFQPENTAIQRQTEPAAAYLRLLAIARLVLDNVPNLQASWVTMGPHVAQLALFFGANDFGSLMIEENVVAAANCSYMLSRAEIHCVIEAAGFTPRQRLMDYSLI